MYYFKTIRKKSLSVSDLKESLRGQVELRLNGWEILGDVMIVEIEDGYSKEEKSLIGEKILCLHPKARAVLNRKGIKNEFREPLIEVLAGDVDETLYRENGCLFKLDPRKIMFSFGNKEERKRMAGISSPDETVLDMFACIGQFAIPLAKHSFPKRVYAVEKNPTAFHYLKENVKLNKLKNVELSLGDCREVCPEGGVDRAIMGHIFEDRGFLMTALDSLNEKGVIHYHLISSKSDLQSRIKVLSKKIEGRTRSVVSIHPVLVKSYAPKRYHWVLDIAVA